MVYFLLIRLQIITVVQSSIFVITSVKKVYYIHVISGWHADVSLSVAAYM